MFTGLQLLLYFFVFCSEVNAIICQGLCTKSYKLFHHLDDFIAVFLYYLQTIKFYSEEDLFFVSSCQIRDSLF